MTFLSSPEALLALAKISALLLVILALAPFLKNPIHRARLWTLTFLVLPLLFASSFAPPLVQLIPSKLVSSEKSPTLVPQAPLSVSDTPPVISQAPLSPQSQIATNEAPAPSLASALPDRSDPPQEQRPLPWFTIIFTLGFLACLLPILLSTIKVLLLPRSLPQDPPLAIWKKIHANSHRSPQLFFTPSPSAPFSLGIVRPQVLLPEDSINWTARRTNSTLFHEAAHLRHHDPRTRLLASIVRALFWFHPLVWIAHRQLISAQEQACDQFALTHGINPADYAEDLLASAAHSHLTPSEALSMAKWSQLGNRIRHILERPKPTSMKTLSITSLLALASTLAFTAIGFSDQKPNAKESPKERNRGTIFDRENKPLAIDDAKGLRSYPSGAASAHIIGYVGKKSLEKPTIYIGKAGIEKCGDERLSQKKDLKLTIDADLQNFCYKLLEKQEFPGAIVVQDPNSGEILGLVSYPSFDNNLFVPFITRGNFEKLQKDKTNPLFNRSVQGSFPPGSTAKPLVILAGSHAGLGNPEFHCEYKLRVGDSSMRNFKKSPAENLRIPSALETGHNCYFYQFGLRTGENALRDVGQLLHLNEPALSSLPSSKPLWMRKFANGPKARPSDLALVSIGQGMTLLSPLDVTSVTSAIATGTWQQAHLLLGEQKTKPPVPLIGKGQITAESLQTIRSGMHLAIHGERGVAKRAALPKTQLAGQTGTAIYDENAATPFSSCSWFSGYGPYEAPKYTVTVLLDSPDTRKKNSVPIAKEVFSYLLESN